MKKTGTQRISFRSLGTRVGRSKATSALKGHPAHFKRLRLPKKQQSLL